MSVENSRRYARQLVLPEISEVGQQKLAEAKVLIVGVGGLGTASAGYLAAMGVGTLGLLDADRVELSNLNRQLLYETGDVGRLKVEAAKDRLEDINPECNIITHAQMLHEVNAASLIAAYDIIVDGLDSFEARFMLNRACHIQKKPWVYAALGGWQGQLTLFHSYMGAGYPCYRCLVPEVPPTVRDCRMEGIVGALPGIIGSMQALEVVKWLMRLNGACSTPFIMYDGLRGESRTPRLSKDANCPDCYD